MTLTEFFYFVLLVLIYSQTGEGSACFTDIESSIVSWFDGDSFDSTTNTWNDKVSGNPGATITGSGIAKLESLAADDENYLNGKPVIFGTTATRIVFPEVLPADHTLIAICRYQNSGGAGRVMNAQLFNGVCTSH